MHKRAKDTIVGTVTAAVAMGALATGLIVNAGADTARTAAHASASQADAGTKTSSEQPPAADAAEAAGNTGTVAKAQGRQEGRTHKKTPAKDPKKAESMPKGTATGTSFWDPATASGKPMRYKTLASPYWPLGTKVKITYNGKSIIGVVDDFGPAEWAVAQHSPPAIIDLSEEMMADFTGTRQNAVPIKFEVLEWGKGRRYVTSGTGHDLAMGR